MFLINNNGNPLEIHAATDSFNHKLLNRFCIATLKSKKNLRNKEEFNEIINFTCSCFLKKFNSGSSIKKSRLYCKDKAAEKYNL